MKQIWENIHHCRARNADKAKTHTASLKVFGYLRFKLKKRGPTLPMRMLNEYRIQSTLLEIMIGR